MDKEEETAGEEAELEVEGELLVGLELAAGLLCIWAGWSSPRGAAGGSWGPRFEISEVLVEAVGGLDSSLFTDPVFSADNISTAICKINISVMIYFGTKKRVCALSRFVFSPIFSPFFVSLK